MTEPNEPPSAMPALAVDQPVVIDVPARWVRGDDMAFVFECANPALQIERWSQESISRNIGFFPNPRSLAFLLPSAMAAVN